MNRKDGQTASDWNAEIGRRDLPRLRAAPIQAAALFINLRGARRRNMEMKRQEGDRKKQEHADPAPLRCIGSPGLASLHEAFDTPVLRSCQTFVPKTRLSAKARC
jgi:hypothetical protein